MFCAVKRFKDKEGRWPRRGKAEDKREVVLADGKPVLRDLARWLEEIHQMAKELDNISLIINQNLNLLEIECREQQLRSTSKV